MLTALNSPISFALALWYATIVDGGFAQFKVVLHLKTKNFIYLCLVDWQNLSFFMGQATCNAEFKEWYFALKAVSEYDQT